MNRLALLLPALALVGCSSTPTTAFQLSADPANAIFQSSWGEVGPLPAVLEPPLEIGRQWVLVIADGHHTQEVRFAFRDRNAPEPFTLSSQRLFGLEGELENPSNDLARDLTLDFESIHVTLVPSNESPVFSFDVDGGYTLDRVRVD